ncbi:HupE/UreJ family protein [Leptolyngbya sp. PCC 6406]|uniref:HupE/UreJ family protein n=1 Tax=Leptolyngbya sp. PCC 6406 TaxID=1173264 RepID=UPI0002AC3B01|nr:HupE/UreJ family protein [Leptolyngbya sp. PCC 6406]
MPTRSFANLSPKLIMGALAVIGSLLLCAPAMAHHPFGGEAPTNAIEGFLSGVGHPVIGLDHLAFIITVGLLAAIFNRGLLIPVAFVVTSLLGTVVHLLNVNLPAPEFFISASVLVFGLLLAMKNSLPSGIMIALAAAAGLFHGYAYGEAVVGAGMPSLLAYLIGFSTIQMAISVGVYLTAKQLGASSDVKPLNLRFAGFTLMGIGAAFLSATVLG